MTTQHGIPAEEPDVIVVGGGIGGLSAAYALLRTGLRVRVLERSAEFGEVGAGMQIAPNCTRILNEYGLLDEAKQLGVLPEYYGHEGRRGRHRADPARPARPRAPLRLPVHGHPPQRPARHLPARVPSGRRRPGHRPAGRRLREHRARRRGDLRGRPASRRPTSSSRPTGCTRWPGGCSSTTSRSARAYVAYRGAVPIEQRRANDISETDVVVYVGPGCHFVQYPLRGGEMFNQVAVFESPKALAGEEDWGTPDELDAAFAGTCEQVQQGLPLMWRDKLVADVRPRPDPDLGARADRPARRRRPPPAAVHGAGRHHGDRGRLGAGPARVPAAAGPQRRRARLGHRARGLRRRTPRALPAGALHRPRRGASCGTTTASSGCSATRSCDRATPTTTPSPSGSTAPRPWSPRTSPSSTPSSR